MTPTATGAVIGLMGGVGLCLVLWRLAARKITLTDRIGPYLRARPRTSRLLAEKRGHTPFPTLERLLTPWLNDLGGLLERLGSTSASIRRRLQLEGGRMSHDQFRMEQLLWSAVGLAVGLFGGLTLGVVRGAPLLPLLLGVVVCTVGGGAARDQMLTRAVRRRQERMRAQLPDVVELLALAVGAGEGPVGALERIVRSTRGALTDEVRHTLADARSGIPLALAFERMAARTDAPAVARFAEGVAVALERGTPLGDVLRAQAQDARESSRRELMETGGKKEMAMMVPVVFLVLPITVIFAIFPGLAVLRVGL
ncbi:type II secretion system F family protein [Georgenia yuyongxinii]|uniref:Type II secretion system F family protein n=1 Tax=Georgenia yuyongxinii TaxID=2589797 RepID=A0A552WNG8_9MICO|nr:type II secretion system F family protein [Georgenia yuyongxinii]TRW44311.1 type II secretion system F family protein [Georgenia yuyongxinii]